VDAGSLQRSRGGVRGRIKKCGKGGDVARGKSGAQSVALRKKDTPEQRGKVDKPPARCRGKKTVTKKPHTRQGAAPSWQDYQGKNPLRSIEKPWSRKVNLFQSGEWGTREKLPSGWRPGRLDKKFSGGRKKFTESCPLYVREGGTLWRGSTTKKHKKKKKKKKKKQKKKKGGRFPPVPNHYAEVEPGTEQCVYPGKPISKEEGTVKKNSSPDRGGTHTQGK